jgi:creatinine amidohydrolase/Fe(II)-dependent formamide hydrolase-like protein
MEDVPKEPFTSLRRNEDLKKAGAYSPMDWYAMYPKMYVGDASKATAEKGKALAEARVDALVKLVRAVKNDEVTEGLIDEFLQGVDDPENPW